MHNTLITETGGSSSNFELWLLDFQECKRYPLEEKNINSSTVQTLYIGHLETSGSVLYY